MHSEHRGNTSGTYTQDGGGFFSSETFELPKMTRSVQRQMISNRRSYFTGYQLLSFDVGTATTATVERQVPPRRLTDVVRYQRRSFNLNRMKRWCNASTFLNTTLRALHEFDGRDRQSMEEIARAAVVTTV